MAISAKELETLGNVIRTYFIIPVLTGRAGSHNKKLQMGWIKEQSLFFPVFEADMSNIRMPADLVPGESSLPGLQSCLLPVASHGLSSMCAHKEGERFLFLLLLMRPLIPS